MTIRKRLTLWYAGLLITIIVLFTAITFGVMRMTMINNIDSALQETASLIAQNSRQRQVPTFGGMVRIEIDLAPLDLFRASNVYVQAWEMVDGEPVFKDNSPNVASLDVPLDPDALGTPHAHYSNVNIQGIDLRVLTTPIFLGDRVVGNLQVAGDLATVNQATDVLLVVMLISMGVAIIGSFLLSMWFSYQALKPIEGITDAASRIAGTNDLSTRLDWKGPQDELGRLTSVFNQMMGRIEHLFSVQQRFVADISHELRTPLTAIRGNVEMVRRYGADDESLEAIEDEAERMSRLVNDLLMLARADYGGIEVDLYPLDLDTVALEAFQQCKILVKDRDLKLTMRQFEPVRIKGNSDRIKQLIYNLVSNAVKFTPDGGEIELGVEVLGHRALLWIKDTGIGIDEDDLSRIFDRFYQTEPSRTHTGGGFGLGLSIAKWIVEAHNARIDVHSQRNIGTTFTITFAVHNPNPGNGSAHNQPTRPRLPIIRRGQSDQQKQISLPNQVVPQNGSAR